MPPSPSKKIYQMFKTKEGGGGAKDKTRLTNIFSYPTDSQFDPFVVTMTKYDNCIQRLLVRFIQTFIGQLQNSNLPSFAGNSRSTSISQLRAGKTRSKRARSHFSSKRRLFPYIYRPFHLLWPITISLFVFEQEAKE